MAQQSTHGKEKDANIMYGSIKISTASPGWRRSLQKSTVRNETAQQQQARIVHSVSSSSSYARTWKRLRAQAMQS